jgi:hypothetical protein
VIYHVNVKNTVKDAIRFEKSCLKQFHEYYPGEILALFFKK